MRLTPVPPGTRASPHAGAGGEPVGKPEGRHELGERFARQRASVKRSAEHLRLAAEQCLHLLGREPALGAPGDIVAGRRPAPAKGAESSSACRASTNSAKRSRSSSASNARDALSAHDAAARTRPGKRPLEDRSDEPRHVVGERWTRARTYLIVRRQRDASVRGAATWTSAGGAICRRPAADLLVVTARAAAAAHTSKCVCS